MLANWSTLYLTLHDIVIAIPLSGRSNLMHRNGLRLLHRGVYPELAEGLLAVTCQVFYAPCNKYRYPDVAGLMNQAPTDAAWATEKVSTG
jgi:hypothetical protein